MRLWTGCFGMVTGAVDTRPDRRSFSTLLPTFVGVRASWPHVIESVSGPGCELVAESAGVSFLQSGEVAQLPCAVASGLDWSTWDSVRVPASHVGMPNFVGTVVTPCGGERRAMWVESLNERNHLLDLLVTRGVTDVLTQPLRLEWQFERGVREHTPDFLVRSADGLTSLVDVTRVSVVENSAALAVFVLTAASAAAMGWGYELRTEMPPQRARNLRFVWSHRAGALQPSEGRVLAGLSWPVSLGELADQLGGGARGRDRVRELVGAGALWVDLNLPWSDRLLVHRMAPSREVTPWVVPV